MKERNKGQNNWILLSIFDSGTNYQLFYENLKTCSNSSSSKVNSNSMKRPQFKTASNKIKTETFDVNKPRYIVQT